MSSFYRAKFFLEANSRGFFSAPYSQLLIASDAAGWVLDEEAKEMIRLAGIIGFPAYRAYRPLGTLRQCVHYTSLFSLADPAVFSGNHRISVDYFHGKPDQDPAFAEVFHSLKRNAALISRLRLSYSGMHALALEAGVAEEKIKRIPIGINPAYFRRQTPELKRERRKILGLPENAVIVGSFQKDGEGWGEGNKPKWVKGPDVFLRALEILKKDVPELFVLLTGPARGFVKSGLDRLGIPYRHFLLDRYHEVGKFFEALDIYLVASREEGGPKAVLESMISSIPLVTTRVGQAIDLVRHGSNAYMADVEDAEALAHLALKYLGDEAAKKSMLERAYLDSLAETYDAQLPRWKDFFFGYVNSAK